MRTTSTQVLLLAVLLVAPAPWHIYQTPNSMHAANALRLPHGHDLISTSTVPREAEGQPDREVDATVHIQAHRRLLEVPAWHTESAKYATNVTDVVSNTVVDSDTAVPGWPSGRRGLTPPPRGGSEGGSSGVPGETVAMSVSGGVFVLMVGGAAVLALKKFTARNDSSTGGHREVHSNTAAEFAVTSSSRSAADSANSMTSQGPQDPDTMHGAHGRIHDSFWGFSESEASTAVTAPFNPRTSPPMAPAGAACKEATMTYIKQQLDCFGPHHLLLGRYQLLGSKERRTGGQSVVQFARRTDGCGMEPYAIKFFLQRSSYQEEADLYRVSCPKLRRFMPKVVKYVTNDDKRVLDPFGNPLPPFIVMEKGESLRDRARNNPVDMFTAAQVLGHVSERIAELHDAGYVHRDLKPGNIMWQPRTYNWVLIDFGLAAAAGAPAAVGFTPTYAAPEMVSAHLQGRKVVPADAAVDAWALGVIAFELLVQRHPFGLFAAKQKVFSELTDPKHALPWESGRISRKDIRKLGNFQKPIMNLLQRDPCIRSTARQFCMDIRRIFGKSQESSFQTEASQSKPYDIGLGNFYLLSGDGLNPSLKGASSPVASQPPLEGCSGAPTLAAGNILSEHACMRSCTSAAVNPP